MSYADRLQKLVEYQTNIRSALEAKGATISSDATLKDFPSAVDTITGDYTGPTPVDIMENGWAPYCSLIKNTTKIRPYEFFSMNITTCDFPYCSEIGEGAFKQCFGLKTVSLPVCKSIGNDAFYFLGNIKTIYAPLCEYLGSNAFNWCGKLEEVSLPALKQTGGDVFAICRNLTSVYMPELEFCNNTFSSCNKLENVFLPKVSYLNDRAFSNCTVLSRIKFDSLNKISCPTYYQTFGGCFNLRSLYLVASSVCALTASVAFSSTPIVGYWHSSLCTEPGVYGSIFVPMSLLESYKTATNWTYFSDRFVGLTDEEISNLDI